jgi:hypothetical protein
VKEAFLNVEPCEGDIEEGITQKVFVDAEDLSGVLCDRTPYSQNSGDQNAHEEQIDEQQTERVTSGRERYLSEISEQHTISMSSQAEAAYLPWNVKSPPPKRKDHKDDGLS